MIGDTEVIKAKQHAHIQQASVNMVLESNFRQEFSIMKCFRLGGRVKIGSHVLPHEEPYPMCTKVRLI